MTNQENSSVRTPDDPPRPPEASQVAGASKAFSRRSFLGSVGMGTAALTAAGVLGPALIGGKVAKTASAGTSGGGFGMCELGPLNPRSRQRMSYSRRVAAAKAQLDAGAVAQECNGDEQLYDTPGVDFKLNSYTKGFAHDPATGLIASRLDWDRFIYALTTGKPADFEALPLTAVGSPLQRRQVNPQCGLATDLQGRDGHATTISNPWTVGAVNANPDPEYDEQIPFPPAPTFESDEGASEMLENYWMALLRDVPFTEYATNPLAQKAAAELTAAGAGFKGPKDSNGVVTPGQHLFRDRFVGCDVGPYVSQFWLRDQPFGAQLVRGQVRSYLPGIDYGTGVNDWLIIQDGLKPAQSNQLDPVLRWMHNGRDLSAWVHIDVLFQGYFQACLLLLHPPGTIDAGAGGLGCPLNVGNPYNSSLTQDPFGTFGGPAIKTIVCEVSTRALKTVWFTKWFVTRRARPEAYAGRVHYGLTGLHDFGPNVTFNPLLTNSLANPDGALSQLMAKYGTLLLPLAFPEGSPLHPSYGAGHATVAGACCTILKYIFDENYILPNPLQPTADGTGVEPWTGVPLTAGGEINKIASNVATGRNISGVHWRTDAVNSILLGEQVTVQMLRDQKSCFNEDVGAISFTGFLGNKITI